MPRLKKPVQAISYPPLEEKMGEFQERVTESYYDAIESYFQKMEIEEEEKERLLDMLIEESGK